MKKLFSLIILFVSPFVINAQNSSEEEPDPRVTQFNELSLGALNLVAFGVLDVSYERIINSYSSWALEGFVVALDRDGETSEAYEKDFSVTGKYKYFFRENHARGFYVNGLAMVSTGEYRSSYEYYYNQHDELVYTTPEQRYTDLALGFGLGVKLVSRRGFLVDLNTGIGRNLLHANSPTVVGQFNFNLGFRF